MQTIKTTYQGPGHNHGSRIVARATLPGGKRRQVTVPYTYEGTAHSEHLRAAPALANRLGWGAVSDALGKDLERGFVFKAPEDRS